MVCLSEADEGQRAAKARDVRDLYLMKTMQVARSGNVVWNHSNALDYLNGKSDRARTALSASTSSTLLSYWLAWGLG